MAQTFDSSPGGFFDQGSTPGVPASAAEDAANALRYANDARGWAVGDTDTPTDGWTNMNNSKYWAMIAQNAANITDTDALRRILAQAEAARDAAIEADSDATRQAEMADSDARAAARVIVETDSDARAAEMFRDQAQTLANNAAQSAIDARGDAMAAAGSAAEAATDAGDADAAASRAANSATDAMNSANNAAQSATQAANSATTAETQANSAAASATEAATSATNAAQSAGEALAADNRAHDSATRARSWAVGPTGDTDASGTATNNAHYWAQQAEAHAAGNRPSDSEIRITVGSNLIGGGNFTLNGSDTDINIAMDTDNLVNGYIDGHNLVLVKNDGDTVTFTGGGGTPLPDPNVNMELNHDEFPLEMSAPFARTITATITPGTGFTASNIVLTVVDQSGNAVTVSGTGNTRTFSININTPGTVVVTGTVTLTRTADSMVFTGRGLPRRTVDIDEEWYGGLLDTAPTDLTDFPAGANLGVYTNNDSHEFTADGSADHQLYLALPTRTGGYTFKSGELFLSRVDTGSVIDSFWTWYRIRDFDNTHNGGTMTITVEEA